jgi:hypothetical protein
MRQNVFASYFDITDFQQYFISVGATAGLSSSAYRSALLGKPAVAPN